MKIASSPFGRVPLLLLLLSFAKCKVSATLDKGNKNEATQNENKRNLNRDDETFWNRFMLEHVSSSFTEEPSASPSMAPTSECVADVSYLTKKNYAKLFVAIRNTANIFFNVFFQYYQGFTNLRR